jgi:hypothetical protein
MDQDIKDILNDGIDQIIGFTVNMTLLTIELIDHIIGTDTPDDIHHERNYMNEG